MEFSGAVVNNTRPRIVALLDGPRFPEDAWAHLSPVSYEVDAVLVRDKTNGPQGLQHLGRRVRQLAPHVPLWINGPLEVALSVEAEGWHLPANQLPASDMRRWWMGTLSASAHTAEETNWHQGADLFIWGHAFLSRSKAEVPPRQTLGEVSRVARRPVLAIGGITPSTLPRLSGRRLSGIVVGDGIWLAADPVQAVRNMRAIMDAAHWFT